MTDRLDTLKESYYEYIQKVPTGVQSLIALVQQKEMEQVFQSLANLAEGVEALYLIEQAFEKEGYQSNSRLSEAIEVIEEISKMLQNKSFEQLEEALQKLFHIFEGGTEWTFIK